MSASLLIKPEEPHPAKATLCLPSSLAGRGWGWGSFIMGNLADMILPLFSSKKEYKALTKKYRNTNYRSFLITKHEIFCKS